ncbi:MAG: Eco57I restriction-modification methylase domain-containing protein, partial [Methanosarcinales archaeon]
MPQMIFKKERTKIEGQKYSEFKGVVKGIYNILEKKINREAIEQIILKHKKIEREDTGDKSSPEEFTRRFIIEKLFYFLGYDQNKDIHFEPDLKKAFGRRYPDYRLVIEEDFEVLVEAEPLNEDLYKEKHGLAQVKEWLEHKKAKTDYGIATNGFEWILIKYNEDTNKFITLTELNIKPFFLEYGWQKRGIDKEYFEKLFYFFYKYFSKSTIKDSVLQQEQFLEEQKELISNKFYQEYTRYVFGVVYDKKGKIKERTKFCLTESIKGILDRKERESLAQTIFNRLVLVKFLESKGFMQNNINFLRDLWKKYQASKPFGSFFNSYLKPLFFDALNNPNPNKKLKAIPYLNGELFRKTEIEEKYPDYEVEDEIISKIIEFLEGYKFQVKEEIERYNTLDPEILGYIYEKTINHEDGSYYTPEVITSYIAKNTIYNLVLSRINEVLRQYNQNEIKNIKDIPKLDTIVVKTLYYDRKILDLKILDPAVGSGQFLLSALHILLKLHKIFLDKLEQNYEIPKLKEKIIRDNLFGVDLKPSAVEICKLRLYLSLTEEVKNSKDIEPLVNIRYNIFCGNSLIGFVKNKRVNTLSEHIPIEIQQWTNQLNGYYPEKANEIIDLCKEPNTENLVKLKDKLIEIYKNEKDSEKAKFLEHLIEDVVHNKLKNRIDNLYLSYVNGLLNRFNNELEFSDLRDLNPFHWVMEFSELFDNGGFDIVIGNPPYGNILSNLEKQIIEKTYLYKTIKTDNTGKGSNNTASLFIERALGFLKQNCKLGFIVPNS